LNEEGDKNPANNVCDDDMVEQSTKRGRMGGVVDHGQSTRVPAQEKETWVATAHVATGLGLKARAQDTGVESLLLRGENRRGDWAGRPDWEGGRG